MAVHAMYSILIVDDHPNNLFTLRTLLEEHLNVEVIEANSGAKALEQVATQKIDLILLDIQMPDMDGFEVADLIRSRKRFQHIPIIFLTAIYKSEEFKQRGLRGGAIDYLTKPIDDAILLNRVSAYLRLIEEERTFNRKLQQVNDQLQQEIEERKKAEERLRQLSQELETLNQQLKEASLHKSAFLANMSHELRTPLNAVIGYTSLTLNSLKDSLPAEHLTNLTKAERSARALLQLINDVLDFSKIEAGQMETFLEEIDLLEILEDIAITAEGLMLDRPVELKTDIPDELPLIESDYTKVKQVLNNLVGNAIKFTTEGHVAIRARLLDDEAAIRVEVEDTGAGIAQERLGNVFESFKQAEKSTSKKFGGTGLGLAISKSFCDMLGMSIGVESEVDKGTLFWLHIPIKSLSQNSDVKQKHVFASESEDTSHRSDSETENQTVLVIDDDDLNLSLTSTIFQNAGYIVYKTLSGREGIDMAQNISPDVILVDLAMPDMNGYEVTQHLKEHPVTSSIPVIACTALATRESQEKALEVGCESVLRRPIDPKDLLEHVRNIVHKTQ